jgi:hypothetical protein
MDDTNLRASSFPGFNFTGSVTTSFDTAGRDALLDPLIVKVLGTGIATQANSTTVKAEMNSLITELASCGGSCEAGRTVKIAKSVCAAAAGSAVMLIQ